MNRYTAEIKNIVDGDTADAFIDLSPFDLIVKGRLRFFGINTPERKEPNYYDAKEFTAELIENKIVELEVYKKDSFGRYLVEIYVDGIHVNNALLENNLAKIYER